MKEFNQLCESLLSIKQTKTIRYPRQIRLSEEFLKALSKEVGRLNTLTESSLTVRNFREKLLKALQFHITELHEKYVKEPFKKKRKKGPAIGGQANVPGDYVGTSQATGAL